MRHVLSVGTVLLSCVLACGDDDVSASTESLTKRIGPMGGELKLPSGAEVKIPADALTSEEEIEITKLNDGDVAPFPPHLEAAGKPYAFKPHGLVFARPVTITLPFESEAEAVRPLKLEDQSDTTWQTIVDVTKDDAAKTLQMDVDGFSVYRAARPRRGSGVLVLPDGAVDDGAIDGSGGTGGQAGQAGQAGTGGSGGTGGDAGQAGAGGIMDGGMDAAMRDATAMMDASIMGDAATTTLSGVVASAYPGETSWLSYLVNDGVDLLSASGAPCVAANMETYGSCIHVGALRSVAVDEIDSCDDVQAISDTANAFRWLCREQGNGVVIHSSGLLPAAGLRDLVDFVTPAWRPLALRITTSTGVYATAPSVWWSDPVASLNTAQGLVGAAGIHVIPSSVTGRALITGDHVAVVSAPGAVLTAPSTQTGQHAVSTSADFSWIEVDFAANGLELNTAHASVVRHSHGTTHGVGLVDSHHCRIDDVGPGISLASNSSYNDVQGVDGRLNIAGASYNTVRDVRALLASSCLTLTSDTVGNLIDGMVCGKVTSGTGALIGGQHNTVRRLVAFADPGNQLTINPIELYGARNRLIDSVTIGGSYGVRTTVNLGGGASINEGAHTIHGLRALNAFYSGVRFDAPNTRLINATIVGAGNVSNQFSSLGNVVINATIALNRGGLNVGAGTTIANIVAIANNLGGVGLSGSGLNVGSLLVTNNRVVGVSAALNVVANARGELVVGNSTTPCEVQMGAVVPFNAMCMTSSPDWMIVTGATALGHVIGETSDSVSALDDRMGRAPFASLAIDDWTALEHEQRVWGPAATGAEVFPDPTVYGPCLGSCQIYDLTPRASIVGNIFLNRMATPDASGVISHVWSAADQAQCDVVEPGAWNGNACVSQLHLLGAETDLVVGDNGDGDGLCEDDEPCIRVRNHGAYQGHGTLSPATGNFDFGGLGTFRFYDHVSNGR